MTHNTDQQYFARITPALLRWGWRLTYGMEGWDMSELFAGIIKRKVKIIALYKYHIKFN
jgi:hypothetical protein